MSEINIGGRLVGEDHPPLVIVELGINHNGSLELAKIMVDAAHRAGAEIIKHQTHIVEDEMSLAAKSVIPGNSKLSIYDIMQACALSEEDELLLKLYVESKGIIFISTPFSRAAADRLEKMGVLAYKIGSGECNNYPLLEHIAGFGKPIILSTGMNDIQSIKKAVKIFKTFGIEHALLHTTNIYPTPPNLVRLGAITELKKAFPNTVIGLSDHTTDNIACLGSVALGASIVERHFTDHMERSGPDIICSMDERACRDLIEGTKILHKELGGEKGPIPEEKATIDFAFATVVTIKDIAQGDVFNRDNLWVKRPGTGDFSAEQYHKILGKRALNNIAKDTHLSEGDV